MSPVSTQFQDYASYHRTPGNQACHMIGIPLIVTSLLGLLGGLVIAGGLTGSEYLRLDAGLLAWASAVAWYLVKDWKLAAPFALVSLGLYFLGRAMPGWLLWSLFVGGWGVQFLGHYRYERKSPAFYKNAEHLLVGPLWMFAKLVGHERR